MNSVETIIIAGGKSIRMDSINKFLLPLAGKSLLDRVIESSMGKIFISSNLTFENKSVTSIVDEVADGGPAVGIWSCLSHTNSDYVLILAADQPFVSEYISDLVNLAIAHPVGAWIDMAGEFQPLASCIKRKILENALKESKGINVSMKQLLKGLNLATLEIPQASVWDIDTWADYFYALGRMREEGQMSDDWVKVIAEKFQIDESILDSEEILNLTREVAHNVERKAAPLTTFLLGVLAGRENLSKVEISKKVSEIEKIINELKKDANE
jgi:molybdopterin-guanine dinucleotide biosynthesis protein A